METTNNNGNNNTNMEMTYSFQLCDLMDTKIRFFDYAIERIKRNKSDIVYTFHVIEKWMTPNRPFLGIIVTENGIHSFDDVHKFWQTLAISREEVEGACIIKQYSNNLYLFYAVNIDDHDLGAEILGLY